jgi:hypothetical protein
MAVRRATSLLLLACGAATAQRVEPRKGPEEYPAQAALKEVTLGVEYLVRSVSGSGRTFFLNDYLVVEVAVFPARGREVAVALSHFRLQVGEKKKREVLPAVGSQFVAASLKYSNWEQQRNLEVAGGVGDQGVIVGRPPATERFPGDPTSRSRLPAPPRAPEPDQSIEPPPRVWGHEVVVACGLPEGPAAGPVAGYLYFPYKGKTKELRPVELVYDGPAGTATVRFR